MKKKNKTKLKVLGVAAAMVMVMGATAVTTWAFTKTDVTSKFEATFIGARDVEATINGASYLASGESSTMVEQISEIKFEPVSTKENVTADFDQAITVVNENDYIYYQFSIKNNSEKTSYSDLIVNPVATITAGDAAVASGFYFSADNTTYTALGAEYITIAKGDTVYLRLKAQLVNATADTTLTGSMKLNLYTEKSVPADYKANYEYSITSGEAYRATIYTDESKGEAIKMQPYEYVIVNPDNAQAILDSDINGKTVVFDAGTYGQLDIRPSKETADIYKPIWNGELNSYAANLSYNDAGEIVNEKMTLEDFLGVNYRKDFHHYVRNIENVTLAGVTGATLPYLRLSSAVITAGTGVSVDPIRDINYAETTSGESWHYSHVNADGVTITGLNFSGKNATLSIYSYMTDTEVKNITISNNTFTGTDDTVLPAINVDAEYYQFPFSKNIYNNFVIKNNIIDNYYQGAALLAAENVDFVGNTVSNTRHNAFAVHGIDETKSSGEINVRNNTLSNVADRAFRFNVLDNADINIENNIITNTGDASDNTILKISASTNTDLVYVNNTLDGVAAQNLKYVDINNTDVKF